MIDVKLNEQITMQIYMIKRGLFHDMLQGMIENDGGAPPLIVLDAHSLKRLEKQLWLNWVLRN